MRRAKHRNTLDRPHIFICILKERGLSKKIASWKNYRYPHQIKKSIWIGKLSDPDFHTPSCPHLHSTDGKRKINVYTGAFYDVQTRTYTGEFLKKREIEELWADNKFLDFVDRARNKLLSEYPDIELPAIPTYDQRAQQNMPRFKHIVATYYIPGIQRWR